MYLSDVTRLSPNATQSCAGAVKPLVGGEETTVCWGIHVQGAVVEHQSSRSIAGPWGGLVLKDRGILSCHQMSIFSSGHGDITRTPDLAVSLLGKPSSLVRRQGREEEAGSEEGQK